MTLAASEVMVRGLTRLGARVHLSEGLLGLLTALGADAPELCSALVAVLAGSRAVGLGVVVGSNAFNLAALLGLSALVARPIRMRRAPVALDAGVGLLVTCLVAALLWGPLPVPVGAGLGALVLAGYAACLALRPEQVRRLGLPRPLRSALTVTSADVPYQPGRDLPVAGRSWLPVALLPVALAAVVGGSFAMVHAALDLARAHHVPDLVTGTLVLAALTSLPNAYAAVHLARLGRGAALMSEAMNSNTLNLLGGIALPAAIFGLGGRPAGGPAFGWMAGLTILALGLALWRKGLGRGGALAILAGYGAFVGLVLAGRL